jgi:biopolymer transport protein ExbD
MKPRPKHELPVVPTANLVDIAILLIIFYMACSNFVQQQTGKIKLPQSPHVDKMTEPLVVVAIDEAGVISVQGKPVKDVSEVTDRLSACIRSDANPEKRRVMVRVDGSVLQDVFGPVMEAVVQAGGIVTAVGEKQKAP